MCHWDLQNFLLLITSVLPWAAPLFLLLYFQALLHITSIWVCSWWDYVWHGFLSLSSPSITPSFPHDASPRNQLTATTTEQIYSATSFVEKVLSSNKYISGSTWRWVRPTFLHPLKEQGLRKRDKGVAGEGLNQSGAQWGAPVEWSFKVREKIKMRSSLFLLSIRRKKMEPALSNVKLIQ